MYPILFNKSRAEQTVAQIAAGKDIAAPAGGWNCDAMLQVAGALLFAAMSHGRPAMDHEQFADVTSANGDTTTQTLSDDLHMAVDFYSDLTMMVCADTYDERFQPELLAVVMRDGEERGFKIIRGSK